MTREFCVFCGREGKLTKEHAWPKWLRTVVPGALEVAPHVHEDAFGHVRRWLGIAFSDEARRTCGNCNNGWMSRLERDAQPLITALILGQSQSLESGLLLVIARWITKTALMLRYTHQSMFIPPSHYRELYSRQQPPKDCRVWVTCATDWRDEVADNHFPFRLVEPPKPKPDSLNAYGITMRVGKFVAQVFGHEVAMALNISGVPAYMAEIWPHQTLTTWPPARTLSEGEADAAMLVFAGTSFSQ